MTKNLFLKLIIDILVIVCVSVVMVILTNLLLSTMGWFLSGCDFMGIVRSDGMVIISSFVFIGTIIGGIVVVFDN